MKYNIFNYDQRTALELGLDMNDLLILDWFSSFRDSGMQTYIQDGQPYYWIRYDYLLRDVPILRIGKDMLYRRLKTMAAKGILKHITVSQGGKYSYYAIGPVYLTLIANDRENSKEDKPNKPQTPSQDPNPEQPKEGLKEGDNLSESIPIAPDFCGDLSESIPHPSGINSVPLSESIPEQRSFHHNILPPEIHQSIKGKKKQNSQGQIDGSILQEKIEALKRQVDFEWFEESQLDRVPAVEAVVEYMAEMVTADSTRIGKLSYTPKQLQRFVEKVDSMLMIEFLDHMKQIRPVNIKNPPAYYKTALVGYIRTQELNVAQI